MKKVLVDLYAVYGYSCSSYAYDSDTNAQFGVSDEVADLLSQMLADKGEALDKEDITNAIEAGHTELKDLYEAIEKAHREDDAAYWLFDSDNDCIDESLEPAFWQDVKDGLYTPEESIDQVIEDYQSNHPDELDKWDWNKDSSRRLIYYDEYRSDYLRWVNSHTDDYYFIAERVGVDLDTVYEDLSELMFSIIKIIP